MGDKKTWNRKLLYFGLLILAATGCAWYLLADRDINKEAEPGHKLLVRALTSVGVEVKNGQAALIKLPKGYAFVVPRRADSRNVYLKVLCSASGDFGTDAVTLREGNYYLSGLRIDVMGHDFYIDASDNVHASVRISFERFDQNVAIALYEGTDPKEVDVSKVQFKSNRTTTIDPEVMKMFLREELGLD